MIQDTDQLREEDVDRLVDGVFETYGYDFRNYARASLKRRIMLRFAASDASGMDEFIAKVLTDEELFNAMLLNLSITVTEMFRDPEFFRALRDTVMPVLRSYPTLKIWHAGCATGEEVYSTAIVLQEEGLYDRCQIYATDYNNQALHSAREGIYDFATIRKATANYARSGGRRDFADYYTAKYDSARMLADLRRNILFSHHNLAQDGPFGEMNLVICRNVMIYFDRELQNRVLGLLESSLSPLGFLCIGNRETLRFSQVSADFEELSARQRIYKLTAEASNGRGGG